VVLLNSTAMLATAKIVYYGPGLCGKTTNLHHIHAKTAADARGEMLSLETTTDRTLFFDLLPLEVGTVAGLKLRLQLYTVPGQVFYNATRKLVLRNVDGIVFVADSQDEALDANLESLANLRANLEELGLGLGQVPLVLQYNKRDLQRIIPVETLQRELNPMGVPYFEAAARHGVGVFETLKGISRLAVRAVREKVAAPAQGGSAEKTTPLRALPEAAPPEPVTVEQQARLRVAKELLREATKIGVHLSFQGRDVALRDATTVSLQPAERPRRLRLRLDLEIEAED
jgi:signal recognition particle receptor subunit beta